MHCADAGVLLDRAEIKKGRTREIAELAKHVAWRYVVPGIVKGATVVKMRWVDRVATRGSTKGPVPLKSLLGISEGTPLLGLSFLLS